MQDCLCDTLPRGEERVHMGLATHRVSSCHINVASIVPSTSGIDTSAAVVALRVVLCDDGGCPFCSRDGAHGD